MIEKTSHDVVIIGAGAAGLSAGLVLARAQSNVLVIDAGEPRNGPAAQMHGYLSRDGMPPAEFLAAGRQEIAHYGGAIESATVTSATRLPSGQFDLILGSGDTRTCRAVLVATGLTDELPDIPGIRERWGSLVHHCPYCHGYEVRNQKIGVIGGPSAGLSIKQVGLLRRYSDRVAFITNGMALTGSERHRLEASGAGIVDGVVTYVAGEPGELDGIALADGSTVPCEAVFVAPRVRPNDGILHSLGCATAAAGELIEVDAAGQTSVPGVWAAGNVVNPGAQVITAAGAGSTSALALNGWLLQQDLDTAAARTSHLE